MASHLSAVILAAGLSSRMGSLKALLPLGGRTVLEQCVALFRDCGIEDVVVVTGHRATEVGAVAGLAGARVAHNPQFTEGMYGSIQTGVRLLAEQSSGFFLLPVDILLLRCGTIGLLAQSFAMASAQICYPVFDGRRGHPPLIAADLIPVILGSADHKGGLRPLLAFLEQQQPSRVREVLVADAHIHLDLDTPDEYLTGCQLFANRDYPSLEECEVILHHLHPGNANGLAHGRAVAEVAVSLGEAIIRHRSQGLDLELCRVGGWLHDLAKGHPRHEEEGARWLRALGFDRAAAIVAAHIDLDWNPGMAIGEREIVHLADKMVRGNRIVAIEERFEEKLTLYGNDPIGIQAIRGRYNLALQLAAVVEAMSGQPIAEIAKTAGGSVGL